MLMLMDWLLLMLMIPSVRLRLLINDNAWLLFMLILNECLLLILKMQRMLLMLLINLCRHRCGCS